MAKTQAADHARVTVLRRLSNSHKQRSSNGSPHRRATSKASARNPAVARVQQADVYSIASSPPPMPSVSKTQMTSAAIERPISRCSSRRSLSSSAAVRTSMSYKRGVSFAHIRRRSTSAHHLRFDKQRDASPLTLQQQYHQEGSKEASPGLVAAESPPHLPPTIRWRKNPARSVEESAARNKKTESHYWKEDARMFSSEIEKVCDEAFNRASMTSTVGTTAPTEPLDQSYHSPATSLGVHGESRRSSNASHAGRQKDGEGSYLNRPLPLPPSFEHLGSFTYRELAKTRALLKQRAADKNVVSNPGCFDDVIAHLDRLMQPSTTRANDQDRRAVSTPDEPTRQPSKDEFEMLLARGPFGLRTVSEPVSKGHRRDLDSRATVRLIDEHGKEKPISPTKPLTIRKKSRSSNPSTKPSQRQRSREKLYHGEEPRPFDRLQGGERRSAGLGLLEKSLEPIEEVEDKENEDLINSKTLVGEGKKRGWFRRHDRAQRSQDSQKAPPLPDKEEQPLQNYENVKASKRASDAPSDESWGNETKKAASGKGRFFRIFSKREPKEPKHSERGFKGKQFSVALMIKTNAFCLQIMTSTTPRAWLLPPHRCTTIMPI